MPQARGSLAQLLLQMQPSFAVDPTAKKTKKVYFATESLGYSRGQEQSKVQRGASRHPTQGLAGNADVAGNITTELMAATAILYAALGSVSITANTPTVGSALTSPTFSASWIAQQVTIACAAHGLAVGDTVEIVASAPAIMNGTFYYPVIDVPTVNTLIILVPMGGTGNITATSVKKCTAASYFTYTYKAGGNLASYILEKGFPDIGQYFKYSGVTCGKIGWSGKASGPIELTSEWMGASEDIDSTSYETGTAFDNTKISFDNSMLGSADILEGGVASAIIKTYSFGLDNVLDGDNFVCGGGGIRAGINPGVYQVTGNVSAIFQDLAMYTKAQNSTESSLDMTYKRGTGAGTAGNESLQVVVPELTFTPKAPVVTGPGGILVEMDYIGYYNDSAQATGMQIVVKCPQLPGNLI